MTWSVRARTRDGRQTRSTLGTWPEIGLSAARRAAKSTIASVQSGRDPVAERRAARMARQARIAERTVTERLEEWRAARESAKAKPWSARYAAEVKRIIDREIVPRLGKRLLRETKREDWTNLVAMKRRKAPALAAMLYRAVSAFLNHAEVAGWIAAPLLPRKGAAAIAPPVPSRTRVLTDAELVEVWTASAAEPPKTRTLLRLLIATATRASEAANIGAGEIDFAEAAWTIPADRAKNRTAVTVPLPTSMLAELRGVMPNESVGDDFRILGAVAGSGFSGFSRLKGRIDARIAAARAKAAAELGSDAVPMPPWRLHDLRRTARTGMTRLGIPRDHAEAALNHVSGRSALERTYDRHSYAPEVHAALSAWQHHVAELVAASAPG